MKILVCSDNHGNKNVLKKVLSQEVFDVSVHLGDSQLSEKWIADNFTFYVGGNHDFYQVYETTFEVDKIKFAICHGHTIGLSLFSPEKKGLKFLKASKAQVLLYGHIHMHSVKKIEGHLLINPGALSLSRGQEGNGYTIITTENHIIKDVEFKKI